MKKLCDLHDNIEINIQSLKALGIESESFVNLLVPVVMEKIPSELRLIIKFGNKETWKFDVKCTEIWVGGKKEVVMQWKEVVQPILQVPPTNRRQQPEFYYWETWYYNVLLQKQRNKILQHLPSRTLKDNSS